MGLEKIEVTGEFSAQYVLTPPEEKECQLPTEVPDFSFLDLTPPEIPMVCEYVWPRLTYFPFYSFCSPKVSGEVEISGGEDISVNVIEPIGIEPEDDDDDDDDKGCKDYALRGKLQINYTGGGGGGSGIESAENIVNVGSCETPMEDDYISIDFNEEDGTLTLGGILPMPCFACDQQQNEPHTYNSLDLSRLNVDEIDRSNCCDFSNYMYLKFCGEPLVRQIGGDSGGLYTELTPNSLRLESDDSKTTYSSLGVYIKPQNSNNNVSLYMNLDNLPSQEDWGQINFKEYYVIVEGELKKALFFSSAAVDEF